MINFPDRQLSYLGNSGAGEFWSGKLWRGELWSCKILEPENPGAGNFGSRESLVPENLGAGDSGEFLAPNGYGGFVSNSLKEDPELPQL